MSLRNKYFGNFFAPPESNTGGSVGAIEDNSISIDDAIKFMGDDEEPTDGKEKPVKDGKKPTKVEPKEEDETEEPEVEEDDTEDEDEEDDDKLEDIEEEIEDDEPDEDKLQLAGPLSRKEILKKYPTIFKEFPQLETSYYRDREFTSVFTTIDEAKEAAESAQVLKSFEDELDKGNIETILAAVKKSDSDVFNSLADEYLNTLAKVDQTAYVHVIGNVVKEVIVSMVNRANKNSNEALREAAQILNQFVFSSDEFEPPKKLATEKKPEDPRIKELEEKERKINERYLTDATKNVDSRVNKFLNDTIKANIDPRGMMSDYIKSKAGEDAYNTVTKLINKDTNFMKLKDKLWEAAKKDSFSEQSVDRIRRAFVSKSKTLLDAVIKKSRNNALRGMGKRVREEKQEEETEVVKESKSPKPASRETPTPRSKGKLADKMKDSSKSTLELLMEED